MEVYEGLYLFHLRKHILHYGEYTITPQEGFCKGMKYHREPFTPNLTLDHSSITLSKNAACSAKKRQNRIYQDNRKFPTFLSLQCGGRLVEIAASQNDIIVKYLDNMISVKVTYNKWLVTEKYMA